MPLDLARVGRKSYVSQNALAAMLKAVKEEELPKKNLTPGHQAQKGGGYKRRNGVWAHLPEMDPGVREWWRTSASLLRCFLVPDSVHASGGVVEGMSAGSSVDHCPTMVDNLL